MTTCSKICSTGTPARETRGCPLLLGELKMEISKVKINDAEKQLYVLTIANSDLFTAITTLDIFAKLRIKNKSDARYTPLMHAFVICYARPF